MPCEQCFANRRPSLDGRVRVRGPLEREGLADERMQPTGRGLGEGAPSECAQLLGRRTPSAYETDLPSFGLRVRDVDE